MRAIARYAVLQGETMPLVSCLEASEALGTSSAFTDARVVKGSAEGLWVVGFRLGCGVVAWRHVRKVTFPV